MAPKRRTRTTKEEEEEETQIIDEVFKVLR